jgi:PAS domain S-box-containing protein
LTPPAGRELLLGGLVGSGNAETGPHEGVALEDSDFHLGLSAAIERSGDSVLVFDSEGRVSWSNPAYLAWSGWECSRVLGRPAWSLPGRPRSSRELAAIRRELAAGHSWQGEIAVWRPTASGGGDEEQRFVFLTVTPILGPSGELRKCVAMGRDVTERRRLEAIAEAHNLHDNLGYVFAGLRHELGNPINSVKVALRFVTDSLDTLPRERLVEYLRSMSEEIDRVEYLLRSLRTYSLFQEPRLVPVVVTSFLESFQRLVRRELQSKGIALGVHVGPEVEVVRADPQALHQVLLNLVANASEAIARREAPRIDLEARRIGSRIRLTVRDNGPGIPPERLPDLFKPFYTTRPGGTGLGLPISRRLALLMNGVLELESSRCGTVAALTLDRVAEPGGRP